VDDPRVVILAAKIMARLLTTHGKDYVTKFCTKTGGFAIMKHRVKRWWNIGTLWPICFAVLFDMEVGNISFDRPFELFSLLETFGKAKVVYPEIFPVIAAMLQNGLKTIVKTQETEDSPRVNQGEWQSPLNAQNGNSKESLEASPTRPVHNRRRSMSLNDQMAALQSEAPSEQRLQEYAGILQVVSQFLFDLHTKSQDFRDFALSSEYIQEILFVLFPVIVSSDIVSAETELNSRDSALTFDGGDVVIRSYSGTGNQAPPIVRTTTVDLPPSPTTARAVPLRRGSSFILVTSDQAQYSPSTARISSALAPKTHIMGSLNVSNSVVEGLLEMVVAVFVDQVLERKDFSGFGLFLKVPPGFQEHQAYFESYLLRNTIMQLTNTLQLNQKLYLEAKVLMNMAKFATYIGESVFEGWFLGGVEPLLDFTGMVLDHLKRPEVAKVKSVRLCSNAILTVRSVFLRLILLRLSELDDAGNEEKQVVSFLDKLMYWQTIILSTTEGDFEFLRLICYLLYTKLIDPRERVRLAAANLWRILLVQKPEETSEILKDAMKTDQKNISAGFKKLMELDNETFHDWIIAHREDLDAFFFGTMSTSWETFVAAENRQTENTAKTRISRRKEKLKKWLMDEVNCEEILRRHEVSSTHWMANIFASEHLKHQRAMQDQQDNLIFIASTFSKLDHDLHRPCGLLEDDKVIPKWKLDLTEGRNRMRMRTLNDSKASQHEYQPKRRVTGEKLAGGLKLDTKSNTLKVGSSPAITPTPTIGRSPSTDQNEPITSSGEQPNGEMVEEPDPVEEDFELVDDPNEDGYEDRNRKVMRSLNHGETVQNVYNVSRIVGLEACEGLLVLGKIALYLMDGYFQRGDSEIVNVWNAPKEERDPYLQMISGRESDKKSSNSSGVEHESRNWRWEDVISISKRRFLFRDVALEVFFMDGRSYLLTCISPDIRDDLYSKLLTKAPHVSGDAKSPHPEHAWRLEALRNSEDAPQTLGFKFASVFNSNNANPATRKWSKGEISNFHYLMLINTMAGRTFNDLTQYPIFPWILADYTSEELDLSNPRTFRDLSKPMGCQTPERQQEFRERYQSFAEMGDHNAPPFHYGTHYSTATTVTSYLIRLQPFVQSYLLLQGGNFDHADRLFSSMEKAWKSASRDNMTDVRELTPEFFYLPEFLVNSNDYNFGMLQGSGEVVNDVKLPPWAKGDPKIFIRKHREALESPYVSKHLHQWIDLVFGYKQRGEAAYDATNVFHHLSYHGAKDLDTIDDPVERLATIGIIHNFGQTPHQVFQRLHGAREELHHRHKGLDITAETLTRLPFPLLGMSCNEPFRDYNYTYRDLWLRFWYRKQRVRIFVTIFLQARTVAMLCCL
jgi:beige protein homolog 1